MIRILLAALILSACQTTANPYETPAEREQRMRQSQALMQMGAALSGNSYTRPAPRPTGYTLQVPVGQFCPGTYYGRPFVGHRINLAVRECYYR